MLAVHYQREMRVGRNFAGSAVVRDPPSDHNESQAYPQTDQEAGSRLLIQST